jgi:glycine dehydrogenase subunit 2
MTAKLRRYHAAVWDEPLVMELGRPGSRGIEPPPVESGIAEEVGDADDLVPAGMRRSAPPDLPELSEPEVLRHYLHLSQQTLGMMGISLFGTCTMKYNPRVNEALTAQPFVADVHPHQDEETLQGMLAIVHGLERLLCELSGMDRFVFQAGGGADASYLHACVTRAYHAARGQLGQRTEVITSIQAHPCNSATAATAGFKVITLPLEENGYPSFEALQSVVSERTASLFINNPDDMGIYNPEITRWVDAVHEAGGLCFYDHANFNGVMSKIRATELGFDACMFMLHKTFGVPKTGGGPAVGAYGCTEALAPYLPGPLVTFDGERYHLSDGGPDSVGRIREFLGNVPQVVKAYAWVRAMGADGIAQASDFSVLANNYMEQRLLKIRGITKSHPHLTARRMEMTRYSLDELTQETGVTAVDVQNRMVDFGVDAFWLSHEPWVVPQPFTPEAGEMWSKDDIDYWIDVLEHVCEEARTDPELVKRAPHNQVVHQIDMTGLDDPDRWATTWRAAKRKQLAVVGNGGA